MKPGWMLAAVCTLFPLTAGPATPGSTTAADDITLSCSDMGYPLYDLLELASEVTGEPFFYDSSEVKEQSAAFTGRIVVPREKFLVVFDRLVHEMGFAHVESVELGRTVHIVRRLGQSTHGTQVLRSMARVLTPDEVVALAERQVVTTTTLLLENVPANEVSVTLQVYFCDASTDMIRNVEGTNLIVMTGLSNHLAGVIRLLRRIDAEAKAQPSISELRSFQERLATIEKRVAELAPPNAKPAGR